ncbi:hypothetical protein [Salinisphaera sp. LB1]|uniref:hypothetical protein n=1 Tax=Salinisphaera sp. LB1 TaxID=2183911 RepID=UPI000D7052A5|nr:hypothetical protein [Salinisphaera sp. LB1]AWN16473.1 hypothetical protein SALB1_2275 [Salinisphaera sp. LB1]
MTAHRRSYGAAYAVASLVLLVVVTLPIYWLLVVAGAPYALCYWVMSFLISGGVYLALFLYREQALETGPFFALTLSFATAMTVMYVLLTGTSTLTG